MSWLWVCDRYLLFLGEGGGVLVYFGVEHTVCQ